MINIYLSVIHVKNNWFDDTEEMLIPMTIGEERQAITQLRKLDRALPVGHRLRTYEEVI